ncbi:MAG: hypothetical protein ACREBO_03365 [Novosphingobium sp.]
MSEVHETRDDTGHTHTTIIDDGRSGGGSGWLIALVLLVAVIGGFFLWSRYGDNEAAKNNAIAGAAQDVGDAAQQVGDAAQDAANSVKKN